MKTKILILFVILFQNTLFAELSYEGYWNSLINKEDLSSIEHDIGNYYTSDGYIILSLIYSMQHKDVKVNSMLEYIITNNISQDRFYEHLNKVKQVYPKYNNELTNLALKLKNLILEAKDWQSLGISKSSIFGWKETGVKTTKQAKQWLNIGVSEYSFIRKLKKIGINTPEEYIPYSKIHGYSAIKMAKSLNVKPTQLIIRLLNTVDFNSNDKDILIKELNILIHNGCWTIEDVYFDSADEYDNEGLCYVFRGELFQRLDRYTGLASGATDKTIFVKFDKSWREGAKISGIIKGLGNFSYETSNGSIKNVPKGQIIFRDK